MAGIQRRQLATLEQGGNVTLSTLRKVLAQLPNLESFSLDVVTATVRRDVPPPEMRKAVESALELLNKALNEMLAKVEVGKPLDEQDAEAIRQALEVGDRGFGYDESDFQRQRERDQAELEAYAAAYTGGAAEAFASIVEIAQRRKKRLRKRLAAAAAVAKR
jgi:hypothetical protein